MSINIGVLALQGAFYEHINYLHKVGQHIHAFTIRSARDFDPKTLHGLIIPGGESTTIGKLLQLDTDLQVALKEFMFERRGAVWGTCAGMILLAKDIVDGRPDQFHFDAMDISVQRNYFGSQTLSFTTTIVPRSIREIVADTQATESNILPSNSFPGVDTPNHSAPSLDSFPGTFIRAPIVVNCYSQETKILAEISHRVPGASRDRQVIVAVEQDNFLATSFHPELTGDIRWHSWWVDTRVLPRMPNA